MHERTQTLDYANRDALNQHEPQWWEYFRDVFVVILLIVAACAILGVVSGALMRMP